MRSSSLDRACVVERIAAVSACALAVVLFLSFASTAQDSDAQASAASCARWRLDTNTDIETLELAGPVLVASGPRRVTGIDPDTGEEIWSVGAEAERPGLSYVGHAASDKAVYALGSDAALRVLSLRTGRELHRAPLWREPVGRTERVDLVVSGGSLFVLRGTGLVALDDAATQVYWRARFDGAMQRIESNLIMSELAVGVIASLTAGAESGQPELILFDSVTGAETVRRSISEPGRWVTSAASESPGRMILVYGGQGYWRVNAQNGRTSGMLPFPAREPGRLALVRWAVTSGDGMFVCFDLRERVAPNGSYVSFLRHVGYEILGLAGDTGQPRWRLPESSPATVIWTLPAQSASHLYVPLGENLLCIGKDDGAVRRRIHLAAPAVASPVVSGEHVFVATAKGVECFRVRTGDTP